MKVKSTPSHSRGFTLAELLVALAVFAILIVFIAQMMVGATKTVRLDESRIDVEGQAQLIFNTMGNDFAHMVLRPDADSFFFKQTGNDCFFFYGEAPGLFDTTVVTTVEQSPISVVGYRINSSYQLERYAKGLTWDYPSSSSALPATGPPVFGSPVPPALTNLWPAEIPSGASSTAATPTNYQILGDGVFRLEFCFLRTNGTYSELPYITNPNDTYGLQDVTAIVITIAALDAKSRALLTNSTTQLAAIAGLLADSGASPNSALTTNPGMTQPTLMATSWLNTINGGTVAAGAHVPQQVVGQIRIYQHIFYLNHI